MKYYQRMKWWYYILLVVGIGFLIWGGIWGGLRFIPPLSEAEVIANVQQYSHLSSQGDWQATYLGYSHWWVERDSKLTWEYFSKTDTTVRVYHETPASNDLAERLRKLRQQTEQK